MPDGQPRKLGEKHWEGSRNPGLQCQLCQSLAAFFYLVSEAKDPRLHRAIKIRLGEKYFATMKEISSSSKMAEKITLDWKETPGKKRAWVQLPGLWRFWVKMVWAR